MQLQLTREELKRLKHLVTNRSSELSSEIHHARVSEYKDELKEERAQIEELRLKLERTLGETGGDGA